MATGTPATLALASRGIAFIPHEYTSRAASAQGPSKGSTPGYGLEAAAALGVEAHRVFKTLLVKVESVGIVVAIVPVSGTLDLKALATTAGGKRATMAEPEVAERKTGYVVGGISPIGQKSVLPAYVDETAQLWPSIYVSGGRRGFDIELDPADLLVAIDARYADIAR